MNIFPNLGSNKVSEVFTREKKVANVRKEKSIKPKVLTWFRLTLEQLLGMLVNLESGGRTRLRLTWPHIPSSVFDSQWQAEKDQEIERIFGCLSNDGHVLGARKLLKENPSRLRFVYQANSEKGQTIVKLNLQRPISEFGHKTNMSMEQFIHTEIAERVSNFLPRLLFKSEFAFGVEYVEGESLNGMSISPQVFEKIVISGLEKLHILHTSQTGRPYLSSDFSRDLNELIEYWSQLRYPAWQLLFSYSTLKLRETYFCKALEKAWKGFEKSNLTARSVLCAWDLSADNLLVDSDSNLWLVDTEDFRLSLSVFDFAAMSAVFIEHSLEPQQTFENLRSHLKKNLNEYELESNSFWAMYEGLLAGFLCHSVFDINDSHQEKRFSKPSSNRSVAFRLQRLRSVIDDCLTNRDL